MKVAIEHQFSGQTNNISNYNSNSTTLGSLIKQSSGLNYSDNYITPKDSPILNLPEIATNQFMPHVYKWSSNIYWIFTVTNASAAVTRTISLFEFNSTQGTISYKGFITLSGTVVAGAKTARSLRAFVYKHTTGMVSTSGTSTTISGSGTAFQSERIAVGARIGFGSNDPNEISTWYEISSINSDTELVISGGGINLSPNTSYVIEEIRVALGITNATFINGGVHLIKGLNYGTFNQGGTTIPEATTVDNIRASYLLKDAAVAGLQTTTFTYSTTNILSCTGHGLAIGDLVYFTTSGTLPTGLAVNTAYYVISTNYGVNQFSVSTTYNGSINAISTVGSGTHNIHPGSSAICATIASDDFVSNTNHSLYLVNGTSITGLAATVTRYNMRASLTVGALTGGPASGVSPSAFVLKTIPMTHIGTLSQLNCGRIFTVNHGSAIGIKSLWFTTNTRIYRASLSDITSGSAFWLSDSMIEVPPGGSTTYSPLSAMAQVDYSASIDRLLISNSLNRFGVYCTPYYTDGSQFDKYFGSNLNRLKLTTTSLGSSNGLFPQATLTLWTEDGWMFSIPSTTTTGLNWLYIFPIGVDSKYINTSSQYVITPKLSTLNATKIYRVYVDHQDYADSYEVGFPVETYRLWYRTSGIDDNSGDWIEIPVSSDLTSVVPSNYIQFKIAFDIIGEICVPTKIYSICCVYEDGSQDSHYQPSLNKSSSSSKIFAWRQVLPWGISIPDLKLRLFDANTNLEIFNDTVNNSAYGSWEYSTDGSTWVAWSSSADAVGNYIRYTATSFGYSGVTVRALLTQS